MHQAIVRYINFKKNAWEPTTQRSERARLFAVADYITGDPETLWTHLVSTQSSYSRLTTWVRVAAFWEWLHPGAINVYKKFRRENSRLFKNAYERKPARFSFEEAKKRVADIKDGHSKDLATRLLLTGLRFKESFTTKNGQVLGKGAKRRDIIGPDPGLSAYPYSYETFRKHLAEVGLKPHDLRKVHATHLANSGFTEFELMSTMGWSRIDTAVFYVAGRKKETLRALARQVIL